MAKLFFRYGAMNSGKSTALLQVAHNYEERDMKVVIIKPKIDSKGDNKVVARIGIERKADILADTNMDVGKAVLEYPRVDCVLVDEAQFLTEKQIDELFELTVISNIPVICYGLRTDFQRSLFPGSARLLALAHNLEELKTVCRCGKKSLFAGRKVNGEFVFKGSQVAIDGEDKIRYESLCGNCYLTEQSEH
jgi:thymidine kinase